MTQPLAVWAIVALILFPVDEREIEVYEAWETTEH